MNRWTPPALILSSKIHLVRMFLVLLLVAYVPYGPLLAYLGFDSARLELMTSPVSHQACSAVLLAGVILGNLQIVLCLVAVGRRHSLLQNPVVKIVAALGQLAWVYPFGYRMYPWYFWCLGSILLYLYTPDPDVTYRRIFGMRTKEERVRHRVASESSWRMDRATPPSPRPPLQTEERAGSAIRRIRRDEVDLYKAIRLGALRESPSAFAATYEDALGRSPESWSSQVQDLSEGADRCAFVALDGSRPVGICALYPVGSDPRTGELMQVWVALEHRSTPLASELVRDVIAWARSREFTRFTVRTKPENTRVIAFYRKSGFQGDELDDEDLVVMTLEGA
jgi:RimJ/RimL family protein N-acetyltransferase